jgi:hypothetical protein
VKDLLRRWQTETGELHLLRLARAGVGLMLFASAVRQARDALSTTAFGDVFRMPMIPASLVVPRPVYLVVTLVQLVLALIVVSGWHARAALFASSLSGLYVLLCDRLQYHNNRYALLLFAFILSFAPCERRARDDSDDSERGPLWAQRLAQLQLAIIYLASGSSKLLDPEWRAGRVIGDRLARSFERSVALGVPAGLMRWLAEPQVAELLSKAAIGTELFLSVGLFLPRLRVLALFVGIVFHVTIEVTSQVELFGWLCLTMYVLFAAPSTRERIVHFDPGRAPSRMAAGALRRLDWLRRFDFRPSAGEAPAWLVVDRDGTRATGLLGWTLTARAIPLLFPLYVPLLLAAKLGRAGERTT